MNLNIEEEHWTQWKNKRRKTFISFIFVGIIVGIDYSIIFSTLFLYLRDTIKTKHSEVYYGFIIAGYQISSSVFGIATGRWLDRTRRVRLFTNMILFLQIIGSILYVIPFNVCFPLIGRFIAGTGDPFISVCTGEVVRIYDERESTQALWFLASCYSVGLVVGPVIPLMFHGIEFRLGSLIINQYNFTGLFMAALCLIAVVVINVLMHDCSKELDLKALIKETAMTEDDLNSEDDLTSEDMITYAGIYPYTIGCIPKPPSVNLIVKKLVSNADVALLLVSTFICMYSMFAVDVLVPLIILVLLQWTLVSLVVFLVASGVAYAALLFLMSKLCNSNRSLYNTMVACLLCGICMFLTIIAIKYAERGGIVDYVLVVLLGVFWLLTTCTEEVLIRALLAKKVPSDVQCFAEALRNGIASMAAIVAAISTPLLLSFVDWWALILMGVVSLLLATYIYRRETLICTKEISFDV